MFIGGKYANVSDIKPLHRIWINMVALVLNSLDIRMDYVALVADNATMTADIFAFTDGHKMVMSKQRMNRFGRYGEEPRMFEARYAGVIFATYAVTLQHHIDYNHKTGLSQLKSSFANVFINTSEEDVKIVYDNGPFDFEKHVRAMGIQFIRAYMCAKKIQSAWREYRARQISKVSKFDMNVAQIIAKQM